MNKCIEFRFMNYIMDMTYGTHQQKKDALYKFRRLRIHTMLGDEFPRFFQISLGDGLKQNGMLSDLVNFVDKEVIPDVRR